MLRTIEASCSGVSFLLLPLKYLRFSGALSLVVTIRCILAVETPHRSAIASNERSVVAFRALIVALVFSGILVFCLSFQNKSPHRMAKVATPRLNE